jgi:hypothetical protein
MPPTNRRGHRKTASFGGTPSAIDGSVLALNLPSSISGSSNPSTGWDPAAGAARVMDEPSGIMYSKVDLASQADARPAVVAARKKPLEYRRAERKTSPSYTRRQAGGIR